jgi:hypothetical protein
VTRALTRPEGTSITTSVTPVGWLATLALSIAHALNASSRGTRGRIPILVPEEHAEVRTFVVGRDQDAAIHVSIASRLFHQELAIRVDFGRVRSDVSALEDRRAVTTARVGL